MSPSEGGLAGEEVDKSMLLFEPTDSVSIITSTSFLTPFAL
jgi:hypothetical protein